MLHSYIIDSKLKSVEEAMYVVVLKSTTVSLAVTISRDSINIILPYVYVVDLISCR